MTNPNDLSLPLAQASAALDAAQLKTKEALRSGQAYVQANPVPTVLGALILLGALLAPRPRKPEDSLQSVRHWLEDSLAGISKVKKTSRGLQAKACDQVSELGQKLKFW